MWPPAVFRDDDSLLNRRGIGRLIPFLLAVCWSGSVFDAQAQDRPPVVPQPIVLSDSTVQIQSQDVRPHVEWLASPERQGRGQLGREATREYITEKFRQLQLRPLFGDSFLQRLPAGTQDGVEKFVGANLGAFLPTSDPQHANEWIVLNAHYDHLGVRGGQVFLGADDNASGVSMLLETARVLSESPVKPRRNIAFVAFDLEEQLLWGSRWFVAHPPCPLEHIKFCLTADLLGRSLGNLPFRSVFVIGTEHTPGLRSLLHGCNPSGDLELNLLGTELVGTRSDYGPFRDEQIPYLFFSTGEHPDYHTPRDTPDKIDYAKLAEISTLIARLTQLLSITDEVPSWERGDPADMLDAAGVHRVAEVLIQADQQGQVPLTGLQRTFVTQVKSRTAYALRKGKMSSDEHIWLVRAAQFMLLSIF